jgi:hypothetical protein
MEPQEYDTIIRHLAAAIAQQETINTDLRTCIQEQQAFNRQQVEMNADVRTTLARIETLLSRMLRQGENGREA